MIDFYEPEEWRQFVAALSVDARIPDAVQAKFERAQKLYLLGWIEIGILKAGELAALIALELAVMDCYGSQMPKKDRSFANLLKHMVEVDGLTDVQIPLIARAGGTAVGFLTGEAKPTLTQRRNAMAHGNLFDELPVSGLLELTRDLINYAYRSFITEALLMDGSPQVALQQLHCGN